MRHVLFLILVLPCLPTPAQSQSGPAVTLPPSMSFRDRNAVITVTMRSATPSPVCVNYRDGLEKELEAMRNKEMWHW